MNKEFVNKTCSRSPIDKDNFWPCSQMCVKSSQCTSAARRKAGAPWSGPASTLDRNGASARFLWGWVWYSPGCRAILKTVLHEDNRAATNNPWKEFFGSDISTFLLCPQIFCYRNPYHQPTCIRWGCNHRVWPPCESQTDIQQVWSLCPERSSSLSLSFCFKIPATKSNCS